MTKIMNEIARLEAELMALRLKVASEPCREVGHDWELIGGRCCDCPEPSCSFPVYECVRCGDCDYGDNEEAEEIRLKCDPDNL